MKPSDLASLLRRIAASIDNSKNPSRELVAQDLKAVLNKLAGNPSGKQRVKEIISKLNDISHKLSFGDITLKSALDSALRIYGKDTKGSDLLVKWLESKAPSQFTGKMDVWQEHAVQKEQVDAANAWHKLVNELQDDDFYSVSDVPVVSVDAMKKQIILDAAKQAKQGIRSFDAYALSWFNDYLRKLEYGPEPKLSELVSRYTLPSSVDELTTKRQKLTDELADKFRSELQKAESSLYDF